MEARIFLIYEKNGILYVQLGGYFNNLEMQNQFQEVIDFLKAKKLHKVLLDLTKLDVLMNLSQVWLNNKWYPEAREDGLEGIAFIVPVGFMTREDIKKLHEQSDNKKIRFGFFDELDEGVKWLNQLSK